MLAQTFYCGIFVKKYVSPIFENINGKIQEHYWKVLFRWNQNLFAWNMIYINK